MCSHRKNSRRGLTLIELLIVMVIIAVVATLAAAFMPRLADRQNVSRGVDLLSQWLLTAKQRARRDGLVTGLRFTTSPNSTNLSATQFSVAGYVQQPDPLTGGLPPSSSGTDPTAAGECTSVTQSGGTFTANFSGVDFTNGGQAAAEFTVQPGDYLELRSSGVHFISAVPSGTQLTLASGTPMSTATFNYRIHRMPRQLPGEPLLEMPGTVVVDLTPGFSQNVPQRTTSAGTFSEILFAPDGSVVGPGVSSGKIILWVRDSLNGDLNLGGLVAVQVRTGFIASYDLFPPVTNPPPASAFQLVNQGEDSGL